MLWKIHILHTSLFRKGIRAVSLYMHIEYVCNILNTFIFLMLYILMEYVKHNALYPILFTRCFMICCLRGVLSFYRKGTPIHVHTVITVYVYCTFDARTFYVIIQYCTCGKDGNTALPKIVPFLDFLT